jgi:hypothetical protein
MANPGQVNLAMVQAILLQQQQSAQLQPPSSS